MFVIIHLRGGLTRVNMSKCVLHHANAIMTVGKIKSPKKRKDLLKILCAENGFINAVSECCWNISNDRVPLTNKQKNIRKKYLKKIQGLGARSGVSQKSKKVYLQKGGFLPLFPLLLGPIIGAITGLIGKKILR